MLNCFKGVPVSDATAENSSTIVPAFEKYFAHLMNILGEKQDQDENKLMENV